MTGSRVELARRARGMSQRDLAGALGVTAMTVSNVERFNMGLTGTLLEAVARATKFPRSFFDAGGQELPPALYRKRQAIGQRRLDSLHALASAYVETHRGLTREVGVNLPPKVPELPRENLEEAATRARAALGVQPDEPIEHVLSLLERAGCVVVEFPHTEAGFDGFSTWAGDVPVIVVDRCADGIGDRRRYTLSHEFAHLAMHRREVVDLKIAESEANRFASAFLLPKTAIRRELRSVSLTPHGLAPLKARWRVSIQAIFMRAVDLELVARDEVANFFRHLSGLGWRKREPIDIPAEHPQVLRRSFEILRKKRPADFDRVAPINFEELAALVGFTSVGT